MRSVVDVLILSLSKDEPDEGRQAHREEYLNFGFNPPFLRLRDGRDRQAFLFAIG
jgi:hypothetical protein